MERDFFFNLYSVYFKTSSSEGSIQSLSVCVCVCVSVTNHCCPQNRMQNVNSRRLNNFLGAMCLEEQEFIVLKYFILPTNKALYVSLFQLLPFDLHCQSFAPL